jgi:alpha-1,6-mannosyltransferase
VGESVDAEVGELAVCSAGPEFAEAVAGLFERDLPALRMAARTRARQMHGWDAVFQRLSDIYAEVSREPAFARPPTAMALAS